MFERKTEGIDPHVALRAGGVTRMQRRHLPLGEPLGDLVGELRHVLRRFGELFAEQHRGEPVAPQDRTRAGGARLRGERGGQAENAAAAVLPHPLDPPPLRARHALDSVVLGQIFVQERVIGVEQRRDRPVILKKVGDEEDRLLLHRAAEGGERRERLRALFVMLGEAVDMEPLRAELLGKPPRLWIAEHPPGLCEQHL